MLSPVPGGAGFREGPDARRPASTVADGATVLLAAVTYRIPPFSPRFRSSNTSSESGSPSICPTIGLIAEAE